MAKTRMELQAYLVNLLGPSVHVYFQAPTKLTYPCLIYERSRIRNRYANNKVYFNLKQYSLTLIYRDPDSELPDIISKIPTCFHDSHYVADNLHHDVYSMYF